MWLEMEPPEKPLWMLPSRWRYKLQVKVRMRMQAERAEEMMAFQMGHVLLGSQQAAGAGFVGLQQVQGVALGSQSHFRWLAGDWPGWGRNCGCPDQCL